MKYFFVIAQCLLLSTTVSFSQESNIISYGISDSILSKEHLNIDVYRSKINFPPFIGWNSNGKKMLFNGGKVIYSMRKNNSEIREYKTFNHNLSSYLSPNEKQFLYIEDTDGNEDYQIFLYDIAKNRNKALSPKGFKSYDPYWSSNSKQITYKSNKRNPAEIDLYTKPLSTSKNEQLIFKNFSDDGQVYDWNSEKKLLLAVKVISENDKLLYLINDQSGEIEQINPNKRNIAYSDARFIPNTNACLIVSDEFSEFLQLHYYDLKQKEFKTITTHIPWDIEHLTIDVQGENAAFSINENGFSKLYILNLKTLKYYKVKDFPVGILQNLSINKQGTKVGFNFYNSTFYRKVFCYDVKKNILKQYARKGKIPEDSIRFIEAEPFTFTSIDSTTNRAYDIPAYIYKSKSNTKPSPVLIDIHGGPEYQIRPKFNGFYQYLVNELGITIIIPNIRGSNGYGKSYMKQDDGKNRMNAIKDIGALLDWIEKQTNLDKANIAVFGESYGGYAVLASLTEYSNRIKCGIDVVGISNWLTYLENTSDYRRDLRRVEFGDERKEGMRNYLEEISPINNVDKILSPVLIFQGLNDPRVNYKESEQIYRALNTQGNEAWYILAKDEGHGFNKYKNFMLQKQLIVSFLKKHLLLQ